MEIRKIPIDQINPAAYNPRKDLQPGDPEYEKLKRSIEEFGYVEPIVWNERTGNVVGGHQRYKVLLDTGAQEIDCVVVDLDETKEKALNLALNKIQGDWDYLKLKDILQELDTGEFDLELTGFDMDEIEDLMTQFHVPEEIIEDEVPEPPEEAITKPGDLWILGRHKLLCGDSTDKATVEKLMGGNKADIAFSSPPYNAGTTATETAMGKTTKYNGNDDNKTEADYINFLNSYIECAIEHCEYVFMNVQSISNNKIALIDVLYHNKDIYADTIVWDKIHGQPAMAENVMNSVFEYVHIFSEKANRAIGTIQFRGTVDNILHLQSQRKNEYSDIHNATFSVEFASHFIRNFAKESVLDQFGGTGTTLIACEQLNRTCYMMELDPIYCDVIVKRWENFTGQKAVLAE